MMRIGDLADRTGKSVHALRYYEAEGLIPNVVRDEGGRRIYSERHVLWIDILSRLRATGMSVDQVRHYAELVQRGDATLPERLELLGEHRAKVQEGIRELRECVRLIDVKVAMYREWLDAGESPVEVPAAVAR